VLWQNSYAFGANPDQSTWGFNLQGGAFLTEDLEVFAAWNYNNIGTDPGSAFAPANPPTAANYFQVGGNWYFAKNNMKFTVLATIPVSNTANQQGANSNAGGSFGLIDVQNTGGGAGTAGSNFGLVVQLQLMF
jgi:hypothetical protein